MADDEQQKNRGKQTRKKRRVEGSATPPRQVFTLRLEQSTLDRLNQLVDSLPCSRNEYIERLIEFDLAYRQRIEVRETQTDHHQVSRPPGSN